MRLVPLLIAITIPLALTSCISPPSLPDISELWDDHEPTLARISPPPIDGHFRWASGGPDTIAIDTPYYDQSDPSLRLYTPDGAVAGCGPTAVLTALTSLGVTGDIAWQIDATDGLNDRELAAAKIIANIGQQMGARYSETKTTTWPERSIYGVCQSYGARARSLYSLDAIEQSIAYGYPVVIQLRGPTYHNHIAVIRRADSRVYDGDRPRRWLTVATGNYGDSQPQQITASDNGSDRIIRAWSIQPLGSNG